MNEQRGQIAFSMDKEIRGNEVQRRLLLAKNAGLLSQIYEHGYHKELLGSEDGQWAGYLGDLEIFYSRNEINRYITLYRKLTSELAIEPENWISLPITRLSQSLPFLTKENHEDWFAKISTLLSQDWKKELLLAQGKEVDVEHEHEMQKYEQCKLCGEKHRI